MIEFDDMDDLREFLASAPSSEVDDDEEEYAAEIGQWLVEGGLDPEGSGDGVPSHEPLTIVVFAEDGDMSATVYAVPDGVIDDDLRTALEDAHGVAFRERDAAGKELSGTLELLAVVGCSDHDTLKQLAASAPGADPDALVARHGAWKRYAIGSAAVLRHGRISHCYATRLTE